MDSQSAIKTNEYVDLMRKLLNNPLFVERLKNECYKGYPINPNEAIAKVAQTQVVDLLYKIAREEFISYGANNNEQENNYNT